MKGYSDCPGCEVEWLRDRAEKAEQLAKRLADDALTSLAGIVCTPVEGYLLAPQCLSTDICTLRKLSEKYHDLLESALPNIECTNTEQDALITEIGNVLAESV